MKRGDFRTSSAFSRQWGGPLGRATLCSSASAQNANGILDGRITDASGSAKSQALRGPPVFSAGRGDSPAPPGWTDDSGSESSWYFRSFRGTRRLRAGFTFASHTPA
jgi:hypothetical protein